MTKFLLLILIVFAMFGSAFSNTKTENALVDFRVSDLSLDGQEAYQSLLRAKSFDVAFMGAFSLPMVSPNVDNVNILLKESKADAAFKSVLKRGEIGGQLYALSGLYFTDYRYFKRTVEKYRKSEKKVLRQRGCLIEEEDVSGVVFSYSENVAIIKSGQTFEDWRKGKTDYVFDIANGGHPAHIRSLTKNKESGN